MKAIKIISYSLIIEVAAISIVVFTGGAGHGTYAPARVLFPYAMLSTVLHGTINDAFILFSCLQFPLYGVISFLALKSDRTKPIIGILIAVHLVAVFLSFVFANPSFPN
ncbi:MAG TPA: hypothetical protein VIU93_12500 [Gallionellaceae bacterium]